MRSNVAAFAGIAVLAVVGWWVYQSVQGDARKSLENTFTIAEYLNRAQTNKLTIRVFQTKEGVCKADTDVKGRAKQGEKFEWTVKTPGYGDGDKCFTAGEKVQLFAKSGSSPLDPSDPSGYPSITAVAKTLTNSYMYEVWLVDSAGKKLVEMEDPELEIVETLRIAR
jgi:hypothetical protein